MASLAELTDINVHLPEDKLVVLDADDSELQLDAERTVKARLSGTFSPVTLASWTDSTNTPATIKEIIGKLIAAKVYARAFSSEVGGVPEYAQWLYDQAMDLLDGIILGTITLPEVTDDPADTGQHLTRDMFWPNDDTGGPRFKRTDVF